MRYAIALSAILALSVPAGAQTMQQQQGKFCLTAGSGMADCKYQTMAACEKAKTGSADKCMPNSMTTGSGSSGGMKEKSKAQ
jgi:hypothetical protein